MGLNEVSAAIIVFVWKLSGICFYPICYFLRKAVFDESHISCHFCYVSEVKIDEVSTLQYIFIQMFKHFMLNCCRVRFVLLCGVALRLLLRNLVKNCSLMKIKCGLVIDHL